MVIFAWNLVIFLLGLEDSLIFFLGLRGRGRRGLGDLRMESQLFLGLLFLLCSYVSDKVVHFFLLHANSWVIASELLDMVLRRSHRSGR